tara:strand:- start:84006 stop:84251 length:246 start_codon:yes stop_codon:yes gene_type:complete
LRLFAFKLRKTLVIEKAAIMQNLIKEEITEEFLERLVDDALRRVVRALEKIDVSLDYVAALLSDEYGDPTTVQSRQQAFDR